jgi:hypothetical protein
LVGLQAAALTGFGYRRFRAPDSQAVRKGTPMEMKFNTLDEVKAKATNMELQGINFRKEEGSFAQGNVSVIHHAEFIFIDAVVMTLPWADVQTPEFQSFNFKLQPSKPNA